MGAGGFIENDGLLKSISISKRNVDYRLRTKNLLFVSPNFLGLPWNCYDDAVSNLRRIHTALESAHEVHFIFYLRPQPDWVSSCVAQWVQQGHTDSPDEIALPMMKSRHIRYSLLIDDLLTVNPEDRLTLRIWDGRDTIQDFLTLVGWARPVVREEKSSGNHRSLRMGGILVQLAVNERAPLDSRQVLPKLI